MPYGSKKYKEINELLTCKSSPEWSIKAQEVMGCATHNLLTAEIKIRLRHMLQMETYSDIISSCDAAGIFTEISDFQATASIFGGQIMTDDAGWEHRLYTISIGNFHATFKMGMGLKFDKFAVYDAIYCVCRESAMTWDGTEMVDIGMNPDSIKDVAAWNAMVMVSKELLKVIPRATIEAIAACEL